MARDRAASWGPGGGKGKGRGVKGGGKGREVRISKALSTVLRHTAQSLGIDIRPDGYCRVLEVIEACALKGLGCTLEDVREAVNSCDKKRFEMTEEGDEPLIRASQGHSMKAVADDNLLRRLGPEEPDLPKVCVHGTYRRHLASILQKGLLAGGGKSQRNHVHFVPYEPGDGRVISGMRYNCEVAVYVDLARALRDGVPFFVSANQVILSPGVNGAVPRSYLQKVKDLQTGQVTEALS